MILLFSATYAIGIGASVLTSTSLLPQLIKIIREKKAGGISIAMLLVLLTGLALWTYYGVLKDDIIITVNNAFSAIVTTLTLVFTIKYKNGKGA